MSDVYRKGYVYIQDCLAGIIKETEKGYCFTYDCQYLSNPLATAISLTLPLRKESFNSNSLFPFFDGLLPEGWLLNEIVCNRNIHYKDRFGLLLATCNDCIGDVSIKNEINLPEHLGEEEKLHSLNINDSFSTLINSKIEITSKDLSELLSSLIDKGYTIPGVQKKVTFRINHHYNYLNDIILKPQANEYNNLPEFEELAMKLADIVGIKTVPHALIRLDNEYAYITKRIDRKISNGVCQKYAMEDFCQLANHLTVDKYKSSYEYCGKIIAKYSSRLGIDITEMFYRIIFSFVIGNSDMHLKNFSLIETEPGNREFVLTDAYDMLPVNVILPEDTEQMALTVNGKKKIYYIKISFN